MKLYLSSQHMGSASHVLLEMIGDKKRVGVIANAIDMSDGRHRADRLQKEEARLNKLGLETEELDLREYFGDSKTLKDRLKQFGMVWVRGGNVYTLVRAMEQSGFSKVASEMIIDDPHEIPFGYQEQAPPMKALGLIDHYIACHYESKQPWAKKSLTT